MRLFLAVLLLIAPLAQSAALAGSVITLATGQAVFATFTPFTLPSLPTKYLSTNCEKNSQKFDEKNDFQKTPFLAIVSRGDGCDFYTKINNAQMLGALGVVVVNSLDSLNFTNNPCLLNCDLFSSEKFCDEKICNGLCGKTPLGAYCCVQDDLIDMDIGRHLVSIPYVFVNIQDGKNVVIPAAMKNMAMTIQPRRYNHVDPSAVLTFAMGCFVLIVASYRAASVERMAAFAKSKRAAEEIKRDHHDRALEQTHLTVSAGISFVMFASGMILVVFFVVQYYPSQVVLMFQLFFVVGSAGSLSHLVLEPFANRICPATWTNARLVYPQWTGFWEDSLTRVISSAIALALGFMWFFNRHETWSVVLMDVLAASLVGTFLISIRIPSVRVAATLLSCFFVYDVFMVFFTPMLFSGKSVMVEVATAGRARERPSSDATTCERSPQEMLPMLFAVPRFDWIGGFSMLGLGDVVLPGMLVVLALRFDYAKLNWKHRYLLNDVGGSDDELGEAGGSADSTMAAGVPRPTNLLPSVSFFRIHAYWIPLCMSYAVGLGLTFIANERGWTINGVRGQPALLYLVPCTLGCFSALLAWRGDFHKAWTDEWLEWENHEFVEGGSGGNSLADDDERLQHQQLRSEGDPLLPSGGV